MSGAQKGCSKCGVEFTCCAGEPEPCWCNEIAPVEPIAGTDCMCRACLSRTAAAQNYSPPQNAPRISVRDYLKEGEDYYMEGDVLVYTARHHLRRGYCCGHGCRHCPFSA